MTDPNLCCTMCRRPAFARLRAEGTGGAFTYLVCTDHQCIGLAGQRATAALHDAATQLLRPEPDPDVIGYTVQPDGTRVVHRHQRPVEDDRIIEL